MTRPDAATEAAFLADATAALGPVGGRLAYADHLEDRRDYARAAMQRILAEPDDDAHRLAFAAVIDEEQPDRAEFIRVQCELARRGPCSPNGAACDCEALRRRERALLTLHRSADWVPEVVWLAAEGATEGLLEEKRGFVCQLRCSWQSWCRHAAALLAACPLTGKDGLVRLTTEPPWETWESPHDRKFHIRLRVAGRPLANQFALYSLSDVTAAAETVARLKREILELAYSGVRFELPAATRGEYALHDDGPYADEPHPDDVYS